MTFIHASSYVSPDVKLGDDVEIGPFSIIHANVILGNRAKVGAYCELGISSPLSDGTPLIIGNDSLIRSHSVFYDSSSFGTGLITGHRVTVREKTVAGTNLQIGTLSDIQGDCTIGDYVRFHSNVHIGKNSKIGNFVWIFPYVVLTNDPNPPSNVLIGCNIEDYAVVATASVLLPGITVGHHSLVAAKSCVTKDVPSGKVVVGVPAKVVGDAKAIKLRDGTDRPSYPWTSHFTRGYPVSVTAKWKADTGEEQ